MNPSLPKESFYPFKTLIRPMIAPAWVEAGPWTLGWERVVEFLERLRDEPIGSGLCDLSPPELLPDYKIDRVARECEGECGGLDVAAESAVALRVMHAIAKLRPFGEGDRGIDPVLNLRAIFYAGSFIARAHHKERCKTCPMSGRYCGDGIFCGRYTVEDFFKRRPGLGLPSKAAAQLDDMRQWRDADFLQLVWLTTMSTAACNRYVRTRVVR